MIYRVGYHRTMLLYHHISCFSAYYCLDPCLISKLTISILLYTLYCVYAPYRAINWIVVDTVIIDIIATFLLAMEVGVLDVLCPM